MSITETETTQSGAGEPRPGYRGLLLRLHFYAGLFVGPFLLVAAITGGLYALTPSIERLVYRDYLEVDSRGEYTPLAEQIRSAVHVLPELQPTAVRPAADVGQTTRVLFNDPTLGSSERRAVFVDPVTARPIGDLVVYGSSGALPMRTWIDNLHRNVHLGDPGRVYSELAASWLWVIALAGAALWISRYRRMKRRDSDGARLLTVDRTVPGRRRTLNWHGAVGIWITAGLLFLSATGLTWSMYAGDHVTELRAALSWTTPTVSTALSSDTADAATDHAGHSGHDSVPSAESDSTPARLDDSIEQIDDAVAAARAAGLDGAIEAGLPTAAGKAFTVAQTRQPWVMSNSTVAVDGATGTVTDASWCPDWPLAAKLSAWGIQLHMGTLFGLPNQLLLLALAGALVTVIVRGYLLWWRRRPTRGTRSIPTPPRRGALTSVPPAAALVIVVFAAAVGWFIPLLGLSLVAFVAVDIAVTVFQDRRARVI